MRILKRCPRCQTEKMAEEFSRNRSMPSGLCTYCRICWRQIVKEGQKRNIETTRAIGRRKAKKRSGSVRAVAAALRHDHGFNCGAIEWARILLADDTRCAICGTPNWKLRKQGFWRVGGERVNRHLSLDHMEPGVNNGNYRALCLSCNRLRGAAVLTDAEVLMKMRSWYRAIFTLRGLYWLNTHVDENGVCVGGKLYRNETMRKKFKSLSPEGQCQKEKDVKSVVPSGETNEQSGVSGTG